MELFSADPSPISKITSAHETIHAKLDKDIQEACAKRAGKDFEAFQFNFK